MIFENFIKVRQRKVMEEVNQKAKLSIMPRTVSPNPRKRPSRVKNVSIIYG